MHLCNCHFLGRCFFGEVFTLLNVCHFKYIPGWMPLIRALTRNIWRQHNCNGCAKIIGEDKKSTFCVFLLHWLAYRFNLRVSINLVTQNMCLWISFQENPLFLIFVQNKWSKVSVCHRFTAAKTFVTKYLPSKFSYILQEIPVMHLTYSNAIQFTVMF